MSLTQDMAMHLGGVPVAMMLPFYNGGKAIFLDVKNGSDSNSGKTPTKAVKTLSQAYTLARNGYNDTIFLLSNTGSTDSTNDYTAGLSATLTWSKNRVHLIGAAAPTGISPRARVATATGQTAAIDPLVTISGQGCIFANVQFFNGIDAAVAANGVKITGQRNFFYRVHFAGIGDEDNDVAGAYSLNLSGGSENLFEECTIGIDTIAKGSAANSEILVESAAARNKFVRCDIRTFAEANTHQFLTVSASGIERELSFINCTFTNPVQSSAVAMTEAFDVDSTQNGLIRLDNPSLIGATDWEANTESGKTYINGGAPTNNTSGLSVLVEAT